MKLYIAAILLTVLSVSICYGQKAEPQISFAQESRPHSYYVEQAELWSAELAKDSLSESAWYNYFRACRNAHGTADWRSDFVNESPALMEGSEILERMKRYIPETFTAYYLSYLTNGIGTWNHDDLMKAYELNPDFPGIHSSVVSYAESSLDSTLRMETNQRWYRTNYLSSQLLTYSYNLLMSLEPNAILMVQADNDSYPTWMLQDVLGIRKDVHVINIDFLLLDEYRNTVYQRLHLPPLDLGPIDINEYRSNWRAVAQHIVDTYDGSRPIYFSQTLFTELYEKYKQDLHVTGLALRYHEGAFDVASTNLHLYENVFLLDSLKQQLVYDSNQRNVDIQNANYISWLKDVYDTYRAENNSEGQLQVRDLAVILAERLGSNDYTSSVRDEFR